MFNSCSSLEAYQVLKFCPYSLFLKIFYYSIYCVKMRFEEHVIIEISMQVHMFRKSLITLVPIVLQDVLKTLLQEKKYRSLQLSKQATSRHKDS